MVEKEGEASGPALFGSIRHCSLLPCVCGLHWHLHSYLPGPGGARYKLNRHSDRPSPQPVRGSRRTLPPREVKRLAAGWLTRAPRREPFRTEVPWETGLWNSPAVPEQHPAAADRPDDVVSARHFAHDPNIAPRILFDPGRVGHYWTDIQPIPTRSGPGPQLAGLDLSSARRIIGK